MINHTLIDKAESFIRECYQELDQANNIDARLKEIKKEIELTRSYTHTYEELAHGAKMAWRNSNRCIGRFFWKSLQVFDARHVTNCDEMAEQLFRHIEYATNDGKIKPTITIFKQAPCSSSISRTKTSSEQPIRLWNHQLIRYAGYETADGIVGDPASITFTKKCIELGWEGAGTPFDVLPLVIQNGEGVLQWYEIPQHMVLQVPLTHPEYDWFKDLRLKWYAVPIIADMRLQIGGIDYTAAPFNGWYMETEIGARNLADEERYNLLPIVANKMGLDTSKNSTLWKDKALIELNIAVLHSYKKAGVSIVDHHTAAEQFKRFEEQEARCGRELTGDWTWLIPPVSPATTHIFHQPYKNKKVTPNYFYQDLPYKT